LQAAGVVRNLKVRNRKGKYEEIERLKADLRHERAMRLKAEWQYEHGKGFNVCLCGYDFSINCDTPERHNWLDADWQAEADRQLKGEK